MPNHATRPTLAGYLPAISGDAGWGLPTDLRFLSAAGIGLERLRLRVYIHETADVPSAERFWLNVTGVDPSQVQKAVLKTHNPKTVRKNVGDGYHGCLRIDVMQSADLYRKIEGWARAAMGPAQYR
jgi:hypothetical protein